MNGVNSARLAEVLNFFPPYRLAEFVLGMLAAAAVRRGSPTTNVPVALAVFLVVAAVPVLDPPWARDQWTIPIFAMPGFLLLITAGARASLERRQSVLHSRALVTLGTWSFALYMTHQLLYRSLRGDLPTVAFASSRVDRTPLPLEVRSILRSCTQTR